MVKDPLESTEKDKAFLGDIIYMKVGGLVCQIYLEFHILKVLRLR